MGLTTGLIYLGALLVAAFLVSGVLPTWRATVRRRDRVSAFDTRYRRWVTGDGVEGDREWLIARRQEMQRDAMSVGAGRTVIAPPPMIGGPAQEHQMFLDLESNQAYADMLVSPQTRIDELATISHALTTREREQRWRLVNPLAWLWIGFERIVALPRYLLRAAGFKRRVTEASLTRAVSVLWALVVGVATIGGFVLALLKG